MFKSETLVRITIQVPEPFVSAATGILTRFKLLHLIRIDETPLGRLGYTAETDGALVDEFDELLREVEGDLETLQVRPDGITWNEEVIPEKEVFKVRERLGEIQREIASALGEADTTKRALGEKKALLERLRLLPGDLDLARLSNRRFAYWTVGRVPAQGLDKLEESLSSVHHVFLNLGTSEERAVILVLGLRKDGAVFERALKGASFDVFPLPSEASGTVDALAAGLEAEIKPLEERGASLSAQRELLQERFGQELLLLREKIIAARQILSARRFFGKVDSSYLISGWIPERLYASLDEELTRGTQGQVLFEKVSPEDLREVRQGIVNIPILFNNPLLISPFEKLTSLYGTPRYREVEPTVFFALSFLLLFGMMFGDVGQGGVLVLLGYIIFRRFYRYLHYGIILMECGVSSLLFGFLYGTVFGLDTLIPALWFRPMESIPYFVKVTVTLGVALLSLGLVLNLVNSFRLKEYEKLLSASGLAGAFLYWMCAGLAVKYLFTGQVAAGELRLIGWAGAVLMTVMILHSPLYRLLVKREPSGRIFRQASFWTGLLESVVELFDDLLRFVANTVSYIRVAAFALSHAALFIAVFSIANVLSHGKGGGVLYWFVVAVGNVIIILLEGLMVSIQAVRLEYYEFFGKFFRGGGETFKPFGRGTEFGVRHH